MKSHATETGQIFFSDGSGVLSASCSCGWAWVQEFPGPVLFPFLPRKDLIIRRAWVQANRHMDLSVD